MRYAIFTDIHANLEALETVLARIDELAEEKPIDQIWFLGDLVGYGPNPNECIVKLRERTDVIIAGNHDWAAVGKLDLEDFSEAARISAQWTAEQLTEEHRSFLADLPERLEIDDCVLVHGSPYGPLWEYLTSEVLAERSFQYFQERFCLVGHTHVPIIFQQADNIANSPTIPLNATELDHMALNNEGAELQETNGTLATDAQTDEDDETTEMVAVRPIAQSASTAQTKGPHARQEHLQQEIEDVADSIAIDQQHSADDTPTSENAPIEETSAPETSEPVSESDDEKDSEPVLPSGEQESAEATEGEQSTEKQEETEHVVSEITPEATIQNAEERLNQEIEELLTLLGLSQSLVQVTNEMIVPPEGDWQAPEGYRAIINPGGVGQPRDGDPRAAFMIYDTEQGFTFYRVAYPFEKTQEKIIKAGLPPYLAARLAFGR